MRSSRWSTTSRPMEAATYLAVAAVLVVAGTLLRTVVLNWVVGPASVVFGVVAISAWLERRRSQR